MSNTDIDIFIQAKQIVNSLQSAKDGSPTSLALILCTSAVKLTETLSRRNKLTSAEKRQNAVDAVLYAIKLLPEGSPVKEALGTIKFLIPDLIDYTVMLANGAINLQKGCFSKLFPCCCKSSEKIDPPQSDPIIPDIPIPAPVNS